MSHGLEALVGLSLKSTARALAEENPAIPTGVTGASAPPAIITSASPYLIILAASPIAWAPVEHAVATALFGPEKPYIIEMWPDIKFTREAGIK